MSPRASQPAALSILCLTPAGVSTGTLRRWGRFARRRLGLTGPIGIVVLPPSRMRQLNAHYRGHDRPTNVLTFDYTHRRRPTAHRVVNGEVMLCPSVIRTEARRNRQSYHPYFRMLLNHAFIHLLGLDHQTAAAARRWQRYVRRLA